MGKQSSFTRRDALNVLSSLSTANTSNSALQAELKRTRRNVSVLASRLREAQTTMALMEEILFSLLPPAPPAKDPPELPPRPASGPGRVGSPVTPPPPPAPADTDMGESSDSTPPGSTAGEPDQAEPTCEASQDAQVVDRPEDPATPPPIADPFGSPETPRRSRSKTRTPPTPMTPLRIGVPPPGRWLCGKDTTPAREWGRAPAPSAPESPTRETPVSLSRPPPSLLVDMRPAREPETPMSRKNTTTTDEPEVPVPQMTAPEAPAPQEETSEAPSPPTTTTTAPDPPTVRDVKDLLLRLYEWMEDNEENPVECARARENWDRMRTLAQAADFHLDREVFDYYGTLVPVDFDPDSPTVRVEDTTTEAPVPPGNATAGDPAPQPREGKKKKRKNKGKKLRPPPPGYL